MRKTYKTLLAYLCLFAFLWQEGFLVHALAPHEISQQVFHLDAQDIDGNGNPADDPVNGSPVEIIVDNFHSHTGSQITGGKRPIFQENSINTHPSLQFDGSNDLLEMRDHMEIGSGTGYSQKSFSLVFRSGNDVSSPQTIYEQGGKEKGFLFHIFGSTLYAGVYNTLDWAAGEQIKILNLGSVSPNTNYIMTMSFDSIGNTLSAHLNGVSATSLNNISPQSTNGTCPLDGTSFGCNLYLSGGSIGIGAVKNDTLNPQTHTGVTLFEGYFFSGFIGEIASWNTALTDTQQVELIQHLMIKWGFDDTPPEITDAPFSSGALLPGGSHDFRYSYQDSGTGASGIDVGSVSFEIAPWNGSGWDAPLSAPDVSTGSIDGSGALFHSHNLSEGKYLLNFSVSDMIGNIQTDQRVIYIDRPLFTLSHHEMDLGNMQAGEIKHSNTLTLNVSTLGAGFRIILEKESPLQRLSGTEKIESWNGSNGYGYRVESGSVQNDDTSTIIVNEAAASIPLGNPILYNYTIDLEALLDEQTLAGEYEGSYSFHIEFDY